MAKKTKKTLDKAALVSAQEMVDWPNMHWDRPSKRDEVLAVARSLLHANQLIKDLKKQLRG